KAQDASAFNHYWRTMGMWFALMYKADFDPPHSLKAPITFCKNVKEELAKLTGVSLSDGAFDETGQPITVLHAIYEKVAELFKKHGAAAGWFPPSSDGSSYFDDTELKLLDILANKNGWTGHNYIRPFNKYHSPKGSSVFTEICDHIEHGQSVFIELSQGHE